MKVAITDANIFIDLIRLELLDCLFKINLEIHTTREVYDQLNPTQKAIAEEFVLSEALKVYNFSPQEFQEVNQLDCPAGLEMADRTVYYYSQKIAALVLSGDKKLRTFCKAQELEVRGILWLLDKFVEQRLITKTVAIEKLTLLLSFNDRLPVDECQQRLKLWSE